eukprot:gene43822-54455_t
MAISKQHDEVINYGKIVSVRGSVIDARFENSLPTVYTLLQAGENLEIAIEGLARGMQIETDGKQLMVPVGKRTLGRMFDVFGNTIDHLKPLAQGEKRNIHQAPPPLDKRSTHSEIFETGIKAIDVLIPLERGGKAGLFGGAGQNKGESMFCGIGERCREGNELYEAMKDAGLLENMIMMFGQMNEPPGARFRVGHAALTMAEYFRDDEHKDVLLLIDNIFRFIQAGMEVSGLMGQMPS